MFPRFSFPLTGALSLSIYAGYGTNISTGACVIVAAYPGNTPGVHKTGAEALQLFKQFQQLSEQALLRSRATQAWFR